MRKNLPEGFTLIELLIVISIIAILSVLGMATYTGIQKNARDSRRKEDINAIANAMEAGYTTANGYAALSASMFSSGSIPIDPINTSSSPPDSACPAVCKYCFWQGTAVQTGAACTVASAKITTSAGPAGGSSSPNWVVCSNLETGGYYCRSNTQ